jgi:hypothetical protein
MLATDVSLGVAAGTKAVSARYAVAVVRGDYGAANSKGGSDVDIGNGEGWDDRGISCKRCWDGITGCDGNREDDGCQSACSRNGTNGRRRGKLR